MDNVEQRVKKIVAEQLGVNEAEIKNESSFVDDLGADSLDTVELVMALEEEFETEIPDEEAEKITTVQQAIDYIGVAPEEVVRRRAARDRARRGRLPRARAARLRRTSPHAESPPCPAAASSSPDSASSRPSASALPTAWANILAGRSGIARDHALRRVGVPVADRRRGQGLRRRRSTCRPRKRGATTRSSTTASPPRWRRSATPASTATPATRSASACASAPASAACR